MDEKRRISKLIFKYISPFDTAAPTVVPKDVANIRVKVAPPNMRFIEKK